MRYWIDEETNINFCEPDCVDEWLELMWEVAVDYDGCNSVESLKELIDELVDMSKKARKCLRENRLFSNE